MKTKPITVEDLKNYLIYCDKAEVPEGTPQPVEFPATLRGFYFWLTTGQQP